MSADSVAWHILAKSGLNTAQQPWLSSVSIIWASFLKQNTLSILFQLGKL